MLHQKMNLLHALVIALLACSLVSNANGRTIDNDVNNAIEPASEEQHQQRDNQRAHFEKDWIKFTKAPPEKVLQPLGQSVKIACEVIGSQVPTVQWVVGNLPLAEIESLESNVITESSASAIVKVNSVHVVDHMLSEPRTYTCVGRTGSETVYASTTVYPQTDLKDLVTMRDFPFPGPYKPLIVYSEKMHLDLVGSTVVLPCKVHASPRAEVTWMNEEGKTIQQSHRFKVLPSGDLLISEIKWEDMGAYKCIARNMIGKDTSDTFIYPVLKEDK